MIHHRKKRTAATEIVKPSSSSRGPRYDARCQSPLVDFPHSHVYAHPRWKMPCLLRRGSRTHARKLLVLWENPVPKCDDLTVDGCSRPCVAGDMPLRVAAVVPAIPPAQRATGGSQRSVKTLLETIFKMPTKFYAAAYKFRVMFTDTVARKNALVGADLDDSDVDGGFESGSPRRMYSPRTRVDQHVVSRMGPNDGSTIYAESCRGRVHTDALGRRSGVQYRLSRPRTSAVRTKLRLNVRQFFRRQPTHGKKKFMLCFTA